MEKQIQQYKTSFLVYIKGEEKPIEISNEAGKRLQQDINNLTFVQLNGTTYNKFEIAKITPKNHSSEITLTPYDKERKERLIKNYGTDWQKYF